MKRTGRGGAAKQAAMVMLCMALVTTPSNVAVAQASDPDNALIANAKGAADLCSAFVHARWWTPQRTAEEAVTRGYTRSTTAQPADYMTGDEVVALGSPKVQVHISVYDYPAGRKSSCTVFADGFDVADYRAVQADYVTRDPSRAYGGGGWLAWSRRDFSTAVTWERRNFVTGSTLVVSTSNINAPAMSFSRVDPPGLPPEAFSEGYGW
jgi:hypothetical protein